MAIFHLEAKVITRGAGRSACAAAAYMSCSKIYNDYDGVQHDFTRKGGLVWERVFLPPMASPEWQDRETLWNAVEAAEKAKDSQLAREFVAALPVELDRDTWIKLLTDFIHEQFVSDGMCADVSVHDTDGKNPHAHILLTMRPLNENGTWQQKTQKEYLCVRGKEERGFTAAEFKTAQNEGWEKQYQYMVHGKKQWMTDSHAKAYGWWTERASKHPKSTRYGRQNPITTRWNSEDQLVAWRAAWADAVNRSLEQAGREERIDHRSHAERGIDEQPTIHEGVAARAMEKQGMIVDRCELNRQIQADNSYLRRIKATIAKLTEAVKQTVPAIADALETIRQNMIVLQYAFMGIRSRRERAEIYLYRAKPLYSNYLDLLKSIEDKESARETLISQRDALPSISVFKRRNLTAKIEEITEEIEELKSKRNRIMRQFEKQDAEGMEKLESKFLDTEKAVDTLKKSEVKYNEELSDEKQKFDKVQAQAADLDQDEIIAERLSIRKGKEKGAMSRIRKDDLDGFSFITYENSILNVDDKLGENDMVRQFRMRQRWRQYEEQQRKPNRNKSHNRDLER